MVRSFTQRLVYYQSLNLPPLAVPVCVKSFICVLQDILAHVAQCPGLSEEQQMAVLARLLLVCRDKRH